MRVCIVGLGYMGLPTALLIAKAGHQVYGYDIDIRKIDKLKNNELPFTENGLNELFEDAKANFKPIHSLELTESIDAFILSLPTPFTENKRCDLSYIIAATKSIAPFIGEGALVVLESTVSPGTTMGTVKSLIEDTGRIAGKNFSLSYVSEKAIPGNTLYEMVNNDRIIGVLDTESEVLTKEIYSSFVKGTLHITDCTTAEIVKLVENTYRDINIAFANDLSNICAEIGVNVWDVIKYANRHPRVNVHLPGPGVGGHCIAIDPWFLIEKTQSQIVEIARNINDSRPIHVTNEILSICSKKGLNNPKILVLGVAYKPNVDDMRESPAIEIISELIKVGMDVIVHDPFVKNIPFITIADLKEAISLSDVVVIATNHSLYYEYSNSLNNKIVIDTRNISIPGSYLLGRDF